MSAHVPWKQEESGDAAGAHQCSLIGGLIAKGGGSRGDVQRMKFARRPGPRAELCLPHHIWGATLADIPPVAMCLCNLQNNHGYVASMLQALSVIMSDGIHLCARLSFWLSFTSQSLGLLEGFMRSVLTEVDSGHPRN